MTDSSSQPKPSWLARLRASVHRALFAERPPLFDGLFETDDGLGADASVHHAEFAAHRCVRCGAEVPGVGVVARDSHAGGAA